MTVSIKAADPSTNHATAGLLALMATILATAIVTEIIDRTQQVARWRRRARLLDSPGRPNGPPDPPIHIVKGLAMDFVQQGINTNIRWSRGFFRIWVLLSVLWVAGIAGLLTISPLYPTPRNRAECEAAAAKDLRVDVAACARTAYEHEMEEAAIVGLPPLLLLIFGAAVGWSVRGFRQPK